MQKTYAKKEPILNRVFDPLQPVSPSFFAALCNVQKSSITRGIEAKLIHDEPGGKIIPARNVVYMTRHILSKKNLINSEPEKRARSMEILSALHSGKQLPSIPVLYDPGKMKDDKFYTLGFFENDSSGFIPLCTYSVDRDDNSTELSPIAPGLSFGFRKKYLSDVYIDDVAVSELFMIENRPE